MEPRAFGRMLFGDFMDAMTGYNEGVAEREKYLTEVIRLATTLLWNSQVVLEDKREPERLWPLPWDKEREKGEEMPEEEKNRIIELQKSYLQNLSDGNDNK